MLHRIRGPHCWQSMKGWLSCKRPATYMQNCPAQLLGWRNTALSSATSQSRLLYAAELLLHPEEAKVTGCTQAACGAEFTMWVCSGKLYSAGNPQYGVLGHGTDHEYNAKDCEYDPGEGSIALLRLLSALPLFRPHMPCPVNVQACPRCVPSGIGCTALVGAGVSCCPEW